METVKGFRDIEASKKNKIKENYQTLQLPTS